MKHISLPHLRQTEQSVKQLQKLYKTAQELSRCYFINVTVILANFS